MRSPRAWQGANGSHGLLENAGEDALLRMKKALGQLRREVPEFAGLVLDEIYSYVGCKARKHYVFTAYGITDTGFVVRYARVFEHCSARSLILFLRDLPPAQAYFSDGAPMYGHVLTTKVLQEKGVMTNLVESFNSQIRQYVSSLRRRTKAFSKTKAGFEQRLALAQVAYKWLNPTKLAHCKAVGTHPT
jgi:IS1 family transposase